MEQWWWWQPQLMLPLPLSALSRNPRTYFTRHFLYSYSHGFTTMITTCHTWASSLSPPGKPSSWNLPTRFTCHLILTVKPNKRPLLRWGWCWSTCFLFKVWLPASLASYKMMRREKTESIVVHNHKVSWCLDFQANLKETNEVLLTMSETICKIYVILSNIDNIISPFIHIIVEGQAFSNFQ